MMAGKWLTYKTDHWCARPLEDMAVEQWLNVSAPMLEDGSFDRCNMYDVEYNLNSVRPDEDTPIIACTSWEYDESVFQVFSFCFW